MHLFDEGCANCAWITGNSEYGQYSIAEQEPVCESVVVDHLPNYIPVIVNVGCFAVDCAQDGRGCERNELAFFEQHRMTRTADTVRTNDVTVIVDSASCG